MIITPSYVTSEFTKFEYQVAQQEMLKRKHRIIPILFDDISECKDAMDPNLKVILNSGKTHFYIYFERGVGAPH
jgi:hypothetical protein